MTVDLGDVEHFIRFNPVLAEMPVHNGLKPKLSDDPENILGTKKPIKDVKVGGGTYYGDSPKYQRGLSAKGRRPTHGDSEEPENVRVRSR